MGYKTLSEEEHDEHISTLTVPSEIEDDEEELDSPHSSGRGWFAQRRTTIVAVAIGLLIAVGAVVGMRFLPKSGAKARPSTQSETPTSMTVTLAPVETTPVVRTIKATGTVAAIELIPVLPQTTGLLIREVAVREGNDVQAGQIMAVLDNSVLQTQLSQNQAQLESSRAKLQQQKAALDQAQAALGEAQATVGQNQANLDAAQRAFDRYKKLESQGAISKQDLDTRETTITTSNQAVRVAQANVKSARAAINSAQANVDSAQADVRNSEAKLQQAKTQLGQTQVLAPASGMVIAPTTDGRCDVNASSGAGTTASQSIAQSIARVGDTSGNKALFCLIRNNAVELQVKIPDDQLSQVHIGAPAIVTSKLDNNIKLQGSVREIYPIVDSQTRQATVKIDLPANAGMRPGMFVQTEITSQTDRALTIPAKAVVPQSDGKGTVYLLGANDIVHAQAVDVGKTSGGTDGDLAARIEVKSGLKISDKVIVEGVAYLKDGDKVKVVDQPANSNNK